ncbi:hypothetical protein BJF79_03125 [Actinomadura sp. CNU-125]|uniref:hypothetical protein n=1 Tax=Actinomadura sp. CNU-125 TaxID=1904961 RepID=UPI00095BDE3D|nr:hypothetical protein [Actinomadura sp. CNU-125]OLT14167.1 hypothetical protein BJF79_03125 [Actinomadura sp. CNU-125]
MTDQNTTAHAEAAHRERVLQGLIDLAAFLEANPGVPVPAFGWTLNLPASEATDGRERAEIDRIADLLNVPISDDTPNGGHYVAQKHFGPITYQAFHVPARRMAQHNALWSYGDNVQADIDGEAA